MKPATLRLMLSLLKPGQVVTCSEIWKKNRAKNDRERIRQWLDEMAESGLVERMELPRQPATKHNPALKAQFGYRLLWRPPG